MAMKKVGSVDEFIEIHPEYNDELIYLRSLMNETELEEKIKWMFPTYTLGNKNVIGLGAFKKYVGIWFFQGVFLTDSHGLLVNAQEGKTQAMRQWRFQNIEEIKKHRSAIENYLAEAIQNQKEGKEIIPQRTKKKVIIPPELKDAISGQAELKIKFDALSDGKKQEYCEYIANAKKGSTKVSRLEKIKPMIMAGIGLNDQYK